MTTDLPKIPDSKEPSKAGDKIDASKSQATIEAESTRETRIGELTIAIGKAKTAFKKASHKLLWQICIWGLICLLIVLSSICFAEYLLDPKKVILGNTWTWQTVYYTTIRVTIIGALFSLATYCFKLLSNSIQMYQRNEHKRAVIDALPGFVESGTDPEKRNTIFNKLIEMVIHFEEADKVADLKTSNEVIVKLIEFIKSEK